MQAEPLLQWADPVKEIVGFVALFLGAGAIGFRYSALRGSRIETDRAFYDDASQRAAGFGLCGVVISAGLLWLALPALAARRHLAVSALVTSDPATMMQAGFLALGLVVLFGLITAWRHLHVLSNLWSTSYGIALIVKLIFAGSVFALGAWNWRRQRPTLGSEEAASSIRHSAIAELSVATLVLVATAIVVSLPAPKGLIRSTIRVILRSGKRQRRSFAWLAMTCRAPPPIV